MDAARLAPDTTKARDAATLQKGGGRPQQLPGGSMSCTRAVGAPVSSLAGAPITVAFPSPGPELADAVRYPHVARANVAVSSEAPEGAPVPNAREAQMTVLERHAAWFDRDGDGKIWPRDTFRGFYELGFNPVLSAISVAVIHMTFSFWTAPSLWAFLRDLPFGGSLRVAHLDRGLHGSDARVYDTEGRFRTESFEAIFSKYGESSLGAGAGPGAKHDVITWAGLTRMIGRNRSIFDPTGWSATMFEWGGLYWVAADHERGHLTKDDVRAMYDGTLWPKLAARVAARRSGGMHPHAT